LKQNGISGRLLKLFENYFSLIVSGVPQGSVLGPLLFFIYINDLERNIKSNAKFFADDTMLFSIVKDPVISLHNTIALLVQDGRF
jgi:hypothetical protein